MKIEIRKATIDDIVIIQGLAEIAFRETYGPILSGEQIEYMMEWMYSEESLRSQMVEKENVFFILSADGSDAGYLSVERHKSPPADLMGSVVFNLQKLYVLPDYQGIGCGSALLSFAEEQMRLWAGTSSRICYELNVNRHNPAVSFYQRHGLRIVREGDFAIGNGFYMNDFIMRKELSSAGNNA